MTFAVLASHPAAAQEDHVASRPRAVAVERTSPIVLDGVLGEAAWAGGMPATDFRQSEPREGEPATQRTEVRFAFDAEALYVGARMYDSLGARGCARAWSAATRRARGTAWSSSSTPSTTTRGAPSSP